MTTITLPEHQWPYQLYRSLRIPALVCAVIAAALLIVGAYVLFWLAYANEIDQSKSGAFVFWVGAFAFIVGFFTVVFTIGYTTEESLWFLLIVPGISVAGHWAFLGLILLLSWTHYPVPDGQTRVDRLGTLYSAGAEAPRGFILPASVPITLFAKYDLNFSRSDTTVHGGQTILTNYLVTIIVRPSSGWVSRQVQQEIAHGVPLANVNETVNHRLHQVSEWSRHWMEQQPIQNIHPGTRIPFPGSWIGSVIVQDVNSTIGRAERSEQ